MIRPLFSLLFTLAFALAAQAELVVRNPVAGFGGKFVPDHFNLLSIEVQNTGSQPFEGRISLDDGGHSSGGVPYVQQIFVSPGATRWVQFCPFVTSYQRWSISWSDAAGHEYSMRLMRGDDSMPSGAPVTVIFNSPDAPHSQQARLPSFMENLFPVSVTATDGLYAAALDHVPRWDAPRRQAFRDWVYRGGIVHLLQGVDGKHPEFSDELAPLNIAGERGVFGAGQIVKHTQTRESITAGMLGAEPQLLADAGGYTEVSPALTRLLADITKPDIPWGFIYLLTVVYVALIGPGFYLQRKRDYRVMLGALGVTVVVFAWLFTVVGRRGYGERQILQSVGYAESLGGNRHIATQWMHAFATSSDHYQFQYPGSGHAYASLASSGTVKATVRSGADAAFFADIPLFSGRPFIHSGVLTGDDTTVEVTGWETKQSESKSNWDNGRFQSLRIRPNANFPKSVELMAVVHRDRIYTLALEGQEWVSESSANTREVNSWFSEKPFNEGSYYGGGRYENQGEANGEARLKSRLGQCGPVLIAQLIGAKAYTRQRITVPDLDPDTARLFIYARTPAGFVAPAKGFQFGGGYILYSQTLRKPSQQP